SYNGYFGGVTAFTRDQFRACNGMSNSYWGWGGEDDDMLSRVHYSHQVPHRLPPQLGRYSMARHDIDVGNEKNPVRAELLQHTNRTWRTDGLNSVKYRLIRRREHHTHTELA